MTSPGTRSAARNRVWSSARGCWMRSWLTGGRRLSSSVDRPVQASRRLSRSGRPWTPARAGSLTLSPALADPSTFARALVKALESLGRPARKTRALASAAEPAFSTLLPPALATLAGNRDTPYVLVVDDLHLLTDPACHDLLAALVDGVPQGSQVAFMSREPAPTWLAPHARAGTAARVRPRGPGLHRGGGHRHVRGDGTACGRPRSGQGHRARRGVGGRALPGRPRPARQGCLHAHDAGADPIGLRPGHPRLPAMAGPGPPRRRDPPVPDAHVHPGGTGTRTVRPHAGANRFGARARAGEPDQPPGRRD